MRSANGMPDVGVEQAGRAAVTGRECGNGVRIDHGAGWTTWYCHLRRGSLRVKEGNQVAVGQPLGLVGLSGDTSFPHVHFDVRHGDQVIDPFVGPTADRACGPGKDPLWRADVMAGLAYQPVVLTNAGFAAGRPLWERVQAGDGHAADLPATSPALVLWVEGYWVAAGDRVRFRVAGPDGAPVVDRVVALDKGWKRWFQFAGEAAAAVRADVGQHVLRAVGAEGALERADPGLGRGRRQVLAAVLAAGSQLQHGLCRRALRLRRSEQAAAVGHAPVDRDEHHAALRIRKAEHQDLRLDAPRSAWAGS